MVQMQYDAGMLAQSDDERVDITAGSDSVPVRLGPTEPKPHDPCKPGEEDTAPLKPSEPSPVTDESIDDGGWLCI
jgi:hypothetical protein